MRNATVAKQPKKSPDEIVVIIAAAGERPRMKTLGVRSLIPIKGKKTLIDLQLDVLRRELPKSEIIVVGGYESDRLFSRLPNGIKVVENEKYAETGVVRTIGIALRATLASAAVIVYGDVFFNQWAIRGVADGGSVAISDSRNHIEKHEVGLVTDEKGNITNFAFGLPIKWGQICFLCGDELKMLRTICADRSNDRLLGFEALNKVIGAGGKIKQVEGSRARLVEIDQPQDIERVMQA